MGPNCEYTCPVGWQRRSRGVWSSASSNIYHESRFPSCLALPASNMCSNSCAQTLEVVTKVCSSALSDPSGVSKCRVYMSKARSACGDTCAMLDDKGTNYTGFRSRTVDGQRCLLWSEFATDKEQQQWTHNYCRNPSGLNESTWCFVEDGETAKCAVGTANKPLCRNDGYGCASIVLDGFAEAFEER